jgi:hypothetical protein
MDEDMNMDRIAKEDVIDAANDPEQSDTLDLLTLYFEQECGESKDAAVIIKEAHDAAMILFDAKRYEDTVEWLDRVATKLSDEEGPDSELYMAFAESEELEDLRMKATDKIFGGEEEEEDDDYNNDDE